ncbi:hypothetical protein KBD08_00460 [Candidatus Babeliales bacterium]|nr:hypothetical protein [Candidatus Babeliales bacterium]
MTKKLLFSALLATIAMHASEGNTTPRSLPSSPQPEAKRSPVKILKKEDLNARQLSESYVSLGYCGASTYTPSSDTNGATPTPMRDSRSNLLGQSPIIDLTSPMLNASIVVHIMETRATQTTPICIQRSSQAELTRFSPIAQTNPVKQHPAQDHLVGMPHKNKYTDDLFPENVSSPMSTSYTEQPTDHVVEVVVNSTKEYNPYRHCASAAEIMQARFKKLSDTQQEKYIARIEQQSKK